MTASISLHRDWPKVLSFQRERFCIYSLLKVELYVAQQILTLTNILYSRCTYLAGLAAAQVMNPC